MSRRTALVGLVAVIASAASIGSSGPTASAATFRGCSWNHIVPHFIVGKPAKVGSGLRVTCPDKHFLRSQVALYHWDGSTWRLAAFHNNEGGLATNHVNRVSTRCVPGYWVSRVYLTVNDHVTKGYSKNVDMGPNCTGTSIDQVYPYASAVPSVQCDDTGASEQVERKPPVSSGPFSFSTTMAPPDVSASCTSGSGSDSASGSFTTKGTIGSSGALVLTESGQGTTTATTEWTRLPVYPGGYLLASGLVTSSTSVYFTLRRAMRFTYSGMMEQNIEDPDSGYYYILERTSPNPARIFDTSSYPYPEPALVGTLPAGSYRYEASDLARNDVCCDVSDSKTDSFNYRLKLTVSAP